MFSNYLKLTWRNVIRGKAFSLINIAGLAIGMASTILILMLIQNDLSYDQFHEKKDRICLMYNKATYDGQLECWPGIDNDSGADGKLSIGKSCSCESREELKSGITGSSQIFPTL